MTTGTGTRSLWRRFRAWLGRWLGVADPKVLIQNPNAVLPDPTQTYDYPTHMEAKDDNGIVRAEVNVRGTGDANINVYDAAGALLARLTIEADGKLTMTGPFANIQVAADGSVGVTGPLSSLSLSADGQINASNASGALIIAPDGSSHLSGPNNADIAIATSGAITVAGAGPLNLNPDNDEVRINTARVGTQAAHVADGATVDDLRDALIASNLMAAA